MFTAARTDTQIALVAHAIETKDFACQGDHRAEAVSIIFVTGFLSREFTINSAFQLQNGIKDDSSRLRKTFF